MAMSKRSVNHLRGSHAVSLPDMAPFAGLFFLLVYFYLVVSHRKGPAMGIVTDAELPRHKGAVCTKGMWPGDNNGLVISLDKAGHFSVAVPGSAPLAQYTLVKRFAFQKGITFTASEEEALKALPFLATSVASLPKLLRMPGYGHKLASNNSCAALSTQQMVEFLNFAQEQAVKDGRRFQVFLRISRSHSAADVAQLAELLATYCIYQPIVMVDAS